MCVGMSISGHFLCTTMMSSSVIVKKDPGFFINYIFPWKPIYRNTANEEANLNYRFRVPYQKNEKEET